MRTIRALVIDDEPLARTRIISLLNQRKDIHLAGDCKNGQEALEHIEKYKPDLIFLDIQMPDFNGFEVVSKLPETEIPFIIFVTAFDQFALKAFDVHAVDYLLKPFDDERFFKSLDYAKKQIELKDKEQLHQEMLGLINRYNEEQSDFRSIIEIKEKGRVKRVKMEDVYWFESHGNYVKINTAHQNYLLRQTLQGLEEELDSRFFLRIHRSIIINTLLKKKVIYKGNNQYVFIMENGEELISGRSFKEEIDAYLDQESFR